MDGVIQVHILVTFVFLGILSIKRATQPNTKPCCCPFLN